MVAAADSRARFLRTTEILTTMLWLAFNRPAREA
jgi:hypothetical protein